MFSSLRRLGVLFTLILEFIVLGKRESRYVCLSIVVTVIGTIIAGWNDLEFNLLGYILTLSVCLFNGLAVVLIPRVTETAKLNPFGLMLYQITLSFPIIFVAAILKGEMTDLPLFPFLFDYSFLGMFLLSCLQIFVLNYTFFLCTQVNSPLTTVVTGNLKNLAQTVGGFVFFAVLFDWYNIIGITVGFVGSALYTVVKYFETNKK